MPHPHEHSLPPAERLPREALGSIYTLLPIVGIILLVLGFLVGRSNPHELAFSWLFTSQFFFTICAGSLFWILLHHAVDANWTVPFRRILEQVAGLFPLVAFAFLIISIFFRTHLWTWMTLNPADEPLYAHKMGYLNQPFFFFRMAFYFTFFCGAALFLRWKSIEQDSSCNPWNTLQSRKLAYPSIPLFVLCITFSGFDWVMGLDYRWYSTMWGVYIFAGSVVSSMALLILISNALYTAGYLRKVMTIEHNHIMGKLLLAFIVFWAYISFSQYFLTWYANIPEETTFYVYRNLGAWEAVSIFIVVGHFILPFLWVLSQPAKKTRWRLCAVAAWMLFMHMVDVYWVVMPSKQIADLTHLATFADVLPNVCDITTFLGLAAIFAYFFLRHFTAASIFPAKDPRLFEAIQLKN